MSECVNSDGREAALARISTSSHVQAVRPGLQRSAWIGTRLLVQTMCSSSWRSWACTSQVGFSWTAHGANYEQKDDWRQRVLTLWPCGMEQSSSASAERRLHPIIRLFQKTLEDGPDFFFINIMRSSTRPEDQNCSTVRLQNQNPCTKAHRK